MPVAPPDDEASMPSKSGANTAHAWAARAAGVRGCAAAAFLARAPHTPPLSSLVGAGGARPVTTRRVQRIVGRSKE